jgi:hypothetical protein
MAHYDHSRDGWHGLPFLLTRPTRTTERGEWLRLVVAEPFGARTPALVAAVYDACSVDRPLAVQAALASLGLPGRLDGEHASSDEDEAEHEAGGRGSRGAGAHARHEVEQEAAEEEGDEGGAPLQLHRGARRASQRSHGDSDDGADGEDDAGLPGSQPPPAVQRATKTPLPKRVRLQQIRGELPGMGGGLLGAPPAGGAALQQARASLPPPPPASDGSDLDGDVEVTAMRPMATLLEVVGDAAAVAATAAAAAGGSHAGEPPLRGVDSSLAPLAVPRPPPAFGLASSSSLHAFGLGSGSSGATSVRAPTAPSQPHPPHAFGLSARPSGGGGTAAPAFGLLATASFGLASATQASSSTWGGASSQQQHPPLPQLQRHDASAHARPPSQGAGAAGLQLARSSSLPPSQAEEGEEPLPVLPTSEPPPARSSQQHPALLAPPRAVAAAESAQQLASRSMHRQLSGAGSGGGGGGGGGGSGQSRLMFRQTAVSSGGESRSVAAAVGKKRPAEAAAATADPLLEARRVGSSKARPNSIVDMLHRAKTVAVAKKAPPAPRGRW